MTSLTRISPLLALAILCGCQHPRHEACNPADSAAICTQVQKCFASDVSTEACREREKDALSISKPKSAPVDDGASKALTY
jgi:uncharacterized protein YgiB involved in biofilm formation